MPWLKKREKILLDLGVLGRNHVRHDTDLFERDRAGEDITNNVDNTENFYDIIVRGFYRW